jgi:hypothetical protein
MVVMEERGSLLPLRALLSLVLEVVAEGLGLVLLARVALGVAAQGLETLAIKERLELQILVVAAALAEMTVPPMRVAVTEARVLLFYVTQTQKLPPFRLLVLPPLQLRVGIEYTSSLLRAVSLSRRKNGTLC